MYRFISFNTLSMRQSNKKITFSNRVNERHESGSFGLKTSAWKKIRVCERTSPYKNTFYGTQEKSDKMNTQNTRHALISGMISVRNKETYWPYSLTSIHVPWRVFCVQQEKHIMLVLGRTPPTPPQLFLNKVTLVALIWYEIAADNTHKLATN